MTNRFLPGVSHKNTFVSIQGKKKPTLQQLANETWQPSKYEFEPKNLQLVYKFLILWRQ